MEGKTRYTHLYKQEHLIFYMHNIPTSGIKKNKSQQLELYTYCSMNKQYMEEVQNDKRFI